MLIFMRMFFYPIHNKTFSQKKEFPVIDLVIVFLVLAIISGLLGFSGVEIISIQIAKILFVVFLILFVISLIMRLVGGKRTPPM
jgi:uncharacterized membrane protein YtjA (UPF0391 family)